MRLTRYSFVILAVVLVVSAFPATALGQTNSFDADAAAVATITQMENSSVKADMAGDSSFVEKNYAENFTGGSSWGNWETKQSILADMKDSKNNKTNSEAISELRVRIYGDTAIATYKSSYDSLYHGDRRARTILSTDTFVRQNGSWKQVASHSSELAK
jgi:ketosteroid isomerase-like protein